MKGAQEADVPSCALPLSMSVSITRRSASARPIFLPRPVARIAAVMSLTVALESTAQCDTSSARLGVDEGADKAGQGFGICGLSRHRLPAVIIGC
jgi:hypothetical protein